MRSFFLITAAVALVATLGWAGNSDLQEQEAQASEYCEMVALYHQSNGEFGWPDYNAGSITCKEQ